jgi:hypothetical protein
MESRQRLAKRRRAAVLDSARLFDDCADHRLAAREARAGSAMTCTAPTAACCIELNGSGAAVAHVLAAEHLGMHRFVCRANLWPPSARISRSTTATVSTPAWVAKAYTARLWDGHLGVESMRTFIHAPALSTLRIC